MAKKFWVDWSDPPFPQIRPEEDAERYETLMTFGEARAEIVNHFRSQVDHARTMIRQTRALRVADIKSENEEQS